MFKPSASRRRAYALCIVPVIVLAVAAFALLNLVPAHRQAEYKGSQPGKIAQSNPAKVQAKFALLPVAFERNDGQTDPQVKYMARGQGYKLYLTSSQAILTVHKRGGDSEVRTMLEDKRLGPARVQKMLQQRRKANAKTSEFAVVHMQMLGSNPAAQLAATDPEAWKVNYFIGKDPSKWQSNVPLFGRVSYKNLYPGVDPQCARRGR